MTNSLYPKNPAADQWAERLSLTNNSQDAYAGIGPYFSVYLQERGVTPEIAADRGYREVLSGKPLDGTFASSYGFPQKSAGLLIPLHGVLRNDDDDVLVCQLRLDPAVAADFLDKKGKPLRFLTPRGQKNVLATAPRTRHLLTDNDQAVVIAEGVTRVDALAAYDVPAIGMTGVWNWKSAGMALPDWESILVKGQRFIIAPDGDARINNKVAAAGRRLRQWLLGKGADRVHVLALPDYLGLDDWIAKSAFADRDALIHAMRELVSENPALAPAGAVKPGAENAPASLGGYQGLGRSIEAVAAGYAADHLAGRFRYDGANWYAWERSAWRLGVSAADVVSALVHDRYELAGKASREGREEIAQLLAERARTWNAAISAPVGDFQASLKIALRRPTPRLDHALIATPTAVVTWATGKCEPLDPSKHDVTATTAGEYRPDDLKCLTDHLRNRLNHALNEHYFDEFARMLGLAVTRWDIDPAIVWLIGASGSGKSWTARLVQAAFGDLAHDITEATLNQRNEIGANLADLIVADPVFGVAIEVSSIRDARLNSLTGRDSISSRHPHGRMVRGVFTGRLIATSVSAPRARAHEGLARRVEAFRFGEPVDASLKVKAARERDDLDAIVTLAIEEARLLQQERDLGTAWKRPQGNATGEFLAAADDVAGWLQELGGEFHGRTIPDVCAAYESATGEKVTPRSLGRYLQHHPRWVSARDATGSRARRLVLREAPLG